MDYGDRATNQEVRIGSIIKVKGGRISKLLCVGCVRADSRQSMILLTAISFYFFYLA